MNERLQKLIQKYRDLYESTRPKLGRWVFCKYCGKNTRPAVGHDYSIVVCSVCNYGLAPMDMVCEAGSYAAWYERLLAGFATRQQA